ncbi:sensor histidine kinase [Aestuariibaculum sediminum]|uniref:Histidine kinase n=1 Tax=Aestuariibaculum sediminum TaxID=2770637 RepID=A0A8J6Q1V3_9FLAO|nr:histidine kinase [Aestuariibaculum sediminum]MBD0831289.1 histidine kinase [Aestuariibaculum sediminum]
MKHIKPTVLILLLLGIFIYPAIKDFNRDKHLPNRYLKKEPDQNWEYVKDRLTTNDGNGRFINRYKTPILFELYDASKEDSLAVNNTIKELRELLPHKTIDYFNNYIGMSSQQVRKSGVYHNLEEGYKYKGDFKILDLITATIKMHFNGYDTTLPKTLLHRGIRTDLGLGNYIFRTNKSVSYNYFDVNYIYFSLNDSVPFIKKEKLVKYEMLRSLCDIKENSNAVKSIVPSAVFNSATYVPIAYTFTYQDEFLLKKLYAPDFDEQFQAYLYKHYNWRYAMHYLSSSELKVFSGVIIALLVLCVVILSKDFFLSSYFKSSYLNYLVPALIILSSILGLNRLYDHLANPNLISYSGWGEVLKVLVFVFTPSLVVSCFVWGLEKLFLKQGMAFYAVLFLKIASLLIAVLIPFSIYYYIVSKYFATVGLNAMSIINPLFAIALVVAIARGVLIYLKSYSDTIIKQKDLELSELKALNTQAELKSLQSQINPHFLYNALNSIAELSHTDAVKTEKMALSLSDLFRYSINRQGKQMSTVKDEVELVQTYLEIEQIRFGERLEFSIEVDKGLETQPLPMFLLQPLVENAVKHGISKLETKGIIKLIIEKTKKGLLISVYDNGPEFPEGLVSGHGLQSVFDLLRLSYKSRAKLNWVNQPEKKIEIVIED